MLDSISIYYKYFWSRPSGPTFPIRITHDDSCLLRFSLSALPHLSLYAYTPPSEASVCLLSSQHLYQRWVILPGLLSALQSVFSSHHSTHLRVARLAFTSTNPSDSMDSSPCLSEDATTHAVQQHSLPKTTHVTTFVLHILWCGTMHYCPTSSTLRCFVLTNPALSWIPDARGHWLRSECTARSLRPLNRPQHHKDMSLQSCRAIWSSFQTSMLVPFCDKG